ncbi:hypothetical protein SUNDANCE_113 [Brevibacillus phage Sundance]|uniref:hypothetical protein n=1 Tax=Brevibacillus phage Sundance TaxID=1691958 RepID=UPI0006BC92AC|nr:hypothetical protein AVT09_gp113 [Brevibacillus phage Sundance]ALA47929.1 hypothetical protein SUNDANCE_113 [Brevibacillus phage Sundance]
MSFRPTNLESLAEHIMFGFIRTRAELELRIEGIFEYRKGKDFEDVKIALIKGFKNGSGKTEREIECVTLYLKDVFKKARNSTTKTLVIGGIG